MARMIQGSGIGEKFFWNWSEDNRPRKENRWFEVKTSGGELEVYAGRLHLIWSMR